MDQFRLPILTSNYPFQNYSWSLILLSVSVANCLLPKKKKVDIYRASTEDYRNIINLAYCSDEKPYWCCLQKHNWVFLIETGVSHQIFHHNTESTCESSTIENSQPTLKVLSLRFYHKLKISLTRRMVWILEAYFFFRISKIVTQDYIILRSFSPQMLEHQTSVQRMEGGTHPPCAKNVWKVLQNFKISNGNNASAILVCMSVCGCVCYLP